MNDIEKGEHLYTSEEKLNWFGYGEWVEEPDKLTFEYKGYTCMIYRLVLKEPFSTEDHYFGGHLCGYVVVKEDHPYYNKGYDEMEINCHGGLTFSEWESVFNLSFHHLIGFDCAHAGDYCPSIEKTRKYSRINEIFSIVKELKNNPIFNPIYRNIGYCIQECQNIVDQLIRVGNENQCKKD